MIRTMLYRPATREITTGDENLLTDWQRHPDAVVHKYGVETPFPQRDLHIRSWADDARVPPAADAKGSV